MTYDRVLEIAGAWAAIATACVAVLAYGRYLYNRRDRMRRLEQHLRNEKGLGEDGGQRSVLHLMRYLRMTEGEVLEAAFRSKRVECLTRQDERGLADRLLFEFEDDEPPRKRGGRAPF